MKIEPRIKEVISLTTSRYFYHCLLDWMDYDENNKLNYSFYYSRIYGC